MNANRETASGLDFQADYSHELFDGTMAWHILGNYTDEKTRTSLGRRWMARARSAATARSIR